MIILLKLQATLQGGLFKIIFEGSEKGIWEDGKGIAGVWAKNVQEESWHQISAKLQGKTKHKKAHESKAA